MRHQILNFCHSSDELSDYVSPHFYNHLCAATTVFLSAQNISDDHPAIKFLHDLETTPYYVDESLSDYNLKLARCIIQAILKWANSHLRTVGGAYSPYVLWFHFSDTTS